MSEIFDKLMDLLAERAAERARGRVRVQLLSERFTDEVHQAVSQAHAEARLLGDGNIGTEHLLLGLLAVPDGLAAELLAEAGMEVKDLRRRIFERRSDEDDDADEDDEDSA